MCYPMGTHCNLVFRYHSDSFIYDDVTDNCVRYKDTASIAKPVKQGKIELYSHIHKGIYNPYRMRECCISEIETGCY